MVALCTPLAVASWCSCAAREPDVARAVEHGDRGRHGAVGAHDALDLGGHLHVLRERHAVADDRALQRDDGPPVGEPALGDFGEMPMGTTIMPPASIIAHPS